GRRRTRAGWRAAAHEPRGRLRPAHRRGDRVTEATAPRRLGRLERPAITGVLVREIVNYSSYWRSATFSSTVEPTIYLPAFGFGWACFGIAIAGFASSIENFSYVISAVLTPLFLVAGTFFPLSQLPEWAQIAGNLNPLHHCVELVRHAAFGWHGWSDLARVG